MLVKMTYNWVRSIYRRSDRIREIFSAKRDPLLLKLIAIREEEFIPFRIGATTQYKFPQRTVISDNGTFNPHEPNFAPADFNIPFWYLKEDRRINSTITSNLKWVDFKQDKKFERRTRAFLKQIMLMIRNKVLLNGGDLANTEIVWFYPSSMPVFRRKFLQKCWTEYYQRYFPDARKLYKMSESFAPFYYFYHKQMVRPHDRPAVNIDIGGGTTDIVVYQSENPILLTSFRFAANAIFGDGYGSSVALNGFVNGFEGEVKEALINTEAQRASRRIRAPEEQYIQLGRADRILLCTGEQQTDPRQEDSGLLFKDGGRRQ